MLWVNVIGPWIFAPAPEDEEDDGVKTKKQLKAERQAKRAQKFSR